MKKITVSVLSLVMVFSLSTIVLANSAPTSASTKQVILYDDDPAPAPAPAPEPTPEPEPK